MKLLPAAGPERTRLTVLLALLMIAGVGWYYMAGSQPPVPAPVTTGRTGANAPPAPRDTGGAKPASRGALKPTVPEALKLAELEKVPDEPEAGRNPFRFGAKPAPPPPSLPPQPSAPVVIAPPPPPPPPQVPLKLTGVIDDPYGKKRAFLVDASGSMFQAVDGDIVDGRYRLVRVEKTSAIVEFYDGTGRKTIYLGRQ
jgi:hypothetical protein